MNRSFHWLCSLTLLGLSPFAQADLLNLEDEELSDIAGQAGLSLDAAITLNPNENDTRCPGGCGLRLAFKPGQSAGYIVVDNVQGTYSFADVTVDVVQRTDANSEQQKVLRLGMNDVQTSNSQFTLGVANQAIPGQNYRQSDMLNFKTTGTSSSSANIHLFPFSP